MIKTSACDLDQPYAPEDQISTNITLTTLNTDLFQNTNWETEQPHGYYPKIEGTLSTALYASNSIATPTKWNQLILLANTTSLTIGKVLPEQIQTYNQESNKNNTGETLSIHTFTQEHTNFTLENHQNHTQTNNNHK